MLIPVASDGRASVPRAFTVGAFLYAGEAYVLGVCGHLRLWEGEGKLGLAWLAGTLALPGCG
jgi:hypothetical protein